MAQPGINPFWQSNSKGEEQEIILLQQITISDFAAANEYNEPLLWRGGW
jgi:hypothetical protein